MEFTTNLSELRKTLAEVSNIPKKDSVPVAFCALHFSVKKGFLLVTAANSSLSITTKLKLTSPAWTEGTALLLPDAFLSFLNQLGDSNNLITVSTINSSDSSASSDSSDSSDRNANQQLTISSPHLQPYSFRLLNTTFPLVSLDSIDRTGLTPTRISLLTKAWSKIKHAADSVVQVRSDQNSLQLLTTDRYRVARVTLPNSGFGEFVGLLNVDSIEQLCCHAISHVSTKTVNQLVVRGPSVLISINLVLEPFPDLLSIVDNPPLNKISVDRDTLVKALARLKIVANHAPTALTIRDSTLYLVSDHTILGSGSEQIGITYPTSALPTPTLECLINANYLLEAVSGHPTGKLNLSWSSPLDPIFLDSTSSLVLTTILMPISIGRPSSSV